MSQTRASKNDQEKPDLSLLPKILLEEISKAYMVGEKKYGRYNYCKGHKQSQLIAAAIRHLTAYFEGEECDPIDGQSHLGAAGASIGMLLRQRQLGTSIDDRYFQKVPEMTMSINNMPATLNTDGSLTIKGSI